MDFQKLISSAFRYAIAGLACGVFYREFTKFTAFTGKTTLAFTHLHLLVMGTLLFLILQPLPFIQIWLNRLVSSNSARSMPLPCLLW